MTPRRRAERRAAPVHLDLGCGPVKPVGFIGADRTPLRGVDVVLDLDAPLPFRDEVADLVLMSHSLEHVRDLMATLREVYRVCRHGARVCIVAPYSQQALNLANPYHKQALNEHSPRFWTDAPQTPLDPAEYVHPQAATWGLSRSDCSDPGIDLRCLSIELFYFPQYRRLPPDEQREARRRHQDVCDQILYQLVVVKRPTRDEDLTELAAAVPPYEPPYVTIRRLSEASERLLADFTDTRGALLREREQAGQAVQEQASEVARLRAALDGATRTLQEREGELRSLQAVTSSRDGLIDRLEAELRERLAERAEARARAARGESDLAALRGELVRLEGAARSADLDLEDLRPLAAERNAAVERAARSEAEMATKSIELARLGDALKAAEIEVEGLRRQCAEGDQRAASGDAESAAQRAELARLGEALQAREGEADGLRNALSLRDQVVERLSRRALLLAEEVDRYRRKRIVSLMERFEKTAGPPQLSESFQRLLDDSYLFQNVRGFRLVSSQSLHVVDFEAYPLRLSRAGLRGVLLAPVLDAPQTQGTLGVEVVSPENEIVAQSTVALSSLSDDAPARIEFATALDLRRSGYWLRVFVREARGPVRVREWRRFRAAGLGRAERRLFTGLLFGGVPGQTQ